MSTDPDAIKIGNVQREEFGQRGWVVGHFLDSTHPFHTTAFELQWTRLRSGTTKQGYGRNKIAKTLTILVEGALDVEFPEQRQVVRLQAQGDYVFFDPGVLHKWSARQDSMIISVRWPSLPGDQESDPS